MARGIQGTEESMSPPRVGHVGQWAQQRKPAAIQIRPKEQGQVATFVPSDEFMGCLHFLRHSFFVVKEKTNK